MQRRRAIGAALAFLVHPDAKRFKGGLDFLAYHIIKEHGPSLGLVPASAPRAAPQQQDERLKAKAKAAKSKALLKLADLTGLEPVKRELFKIHDMVELDKDRGVDSKDQQYSAIFYGNPGESVRL